ncbi:MAG: SRPBCC family protein [Acidobacteria bacterium]|nr:SRPBCC family protein [Acidobacteriota bacterium]
MILARHALETTAGGEAVWRRWVDVATWPSWDPSLEQAAIHGPFQVGTTLDLAAPGRGPTTWRIATLDPHTSFTCEARLPGARLRAVRSLEECPMGTRVTQRFDIEGPLAWLHVLLLRESAAHSLPSALRALARSAEHPL